MNKQRAIIGTSMRSLLTVMLLSVLQAAGLPTGAGGIAAADSTGGTGPDYPGKRSSKSTADKIISFPGRVISYPFELLFSGAGAAAGWAVDKRIPDTVKEWTTYYDGRAGIRAKYSTREGGGADLFLKERAGEEAKMHLTATAWFDSRQSYRLQLKKIRLGTDLFTGGLKAGYIRLPDEYFYGTGPNSAEEDRTDYLFESAYAMVGITMTPTGMLELIAGAGVENNSVRDGRDGDYPATSELFGDAGLAGMTGGLGMLKASAGLLFDSTDQSRYGTRVLLSGWYADELNGNQYGFTGLSAELEQEVPLVYGRSLVFKVLTSSVRPSRGRIVPFYELSAMGGLETLRGYPWGRFRDRGMLSGSIEYYYPIWAHGARSLKTFLFSDAGQVTDRLFSGLSLDRTKVSVGAGAVLFGLEGEWIRGTIGWSREGFEFYLSWN